MAGGKFNKDKLAKNLQLVIARIDVLKKKTDAVNKRNMTGIAELISNKQIESAMLKVESLCREDYLMEAFEKLSNYCETVLSRMSIFVNTVGCDDSLVESVSMILWCTSKVNLRLPEMQVIFGELRRKLGDLFVKDKVEMDVRLINKKFYSGITCQNPPIKVIDGYLHSIARTYGVEYNTPIEVVEKIQHENDMKENKLNVSVELGMTLEQMVKKDEEEEERRKKKKSSLIKKFSKDKKSFNAPKAQPIFYPSGDRAVNDPNAAENLGPPIVTSVLETIHGNNASNISHEDEIFNERIRNSAKAKEAEENSHKVVSPVAQPPEYNEQVFAPPNNINVQAVPYNPFVDVEQTSTQNGESEENVEIDNSLLEDESEVDMELFAKNLKNFYPDKN